MTQEKQTPQRKNAQAAAAIAASTIATLSLGIANIVSVLSKDAQFLIYELGKAWIPGAEAIGPYSGKETIMLLGWGISWLVLHIALRNKQVRLTAHTIIFIIGVGFATLLVWTPFVDMIK